MLVSIAREAGGLTDEEYALLESVGDKTPAEPMRLEWSSSTPTWFPSCGRSNRIPRWF